MHRDFCHPLFKKVPSKDFLLRKNNTTIIRYYCKSLNIFWNFLDENIEISRESFIFSENAEMSREHAGVKSSLNLIGILWGFLIKGKGKWKLIDVTLLFRLQKRSK